MKTDLSNAPFSEVLPKFIEMADDWRSWEARLKEIGEKNLREVDVLTFLSAVSESEDVWKLSLSCAAYALSLQRPGLYYESRPDSTALAIAEVLSSRRREPEGFKEIAKKICKDRYPQVNRVVPRLLTILRDIPVLPPITVLDSGFCMQTYGHDYKKFLECMRK